MTLCCNCVSILTWVCRVVCVCVCVCLCVCVCVSVQQLLRSKSRLTSTFVFDSHTLAGRYNKVQQGTSRYSKVQHGTTRYSTVQQGTARYITEHLTTLESCWTTNCPVQVHSHVTVIFFGSVVDDGSSTQRQRPTAFGQRTSRYNTAHHRTSRNSTVHHGTTRHNTAHHGT
jgi:hypothetical protein